MKHLIVILFLISLHTPTVVSACDCKEIYPIDSLRKKSFAWSDVVFLGELAEVDTISQTYTFTVLELFKGDTVHKTLKGKRFDSCSKMPAEKGRWLVYAETRGSFININDCLASRSEEDPFCVNCLPPPPPPKRGREGLEQSEKAVNDYKQRLKALWYEELEWLRIHCN